MSHSQDPTNSDRSSKKKKMGKGLSSLFDKTDLSGILEKKTSSRPVLFSASNQQSDAQIVDLPVRQIVPNPHQPRIYFDEEKIDELAESIKQVGMIEPIIVTQVKDKFELVAGERRWRATQKLGIDKIPALVKNQVTDHILEMMLIENIQREDLSPLEEAESYQLILKKQKITQEELSKRVGKSRSHITNLIRILSLSPLAKKYLSQGKLSVGQAKILLSNKEKMTDQLIQQIVDRELTVKEIETKLRPQKNSKAENAPQTADPNLLEIENQFREKLKTKVLLHDLKKGVGKLEIEYYNYNDLIDLLNKIKE